MPSEQQLAEVRDLTDLPEERDPVGRGGALSHGILRRQGAQRVEVVRALDPLERLARGRGRQRPDQRLGALEVERRAPPHQAPHGGEAVLLDRAHHALVQRGQRVERAEGAVALVAPGPPRDLRQLRRGEVALVLAVELPQRGERDVVDVEVQAHADRVGGHDVLHLAGLIEGDLGVPCARGQRAEHHRGAAAARLQPGRERVDLVGAEGDDRGARRQPAEPAPARVPQLGEAHLTTEVRVGQERAPDRRHPVRAEEPRLATAAQPEQPVGEDVPALAMRGELDLVDGDEVHHALGRHRLDRAHPVPRARRGALLFPRDEGHRGFADLRGDPVVDLTRQQAQRQPDHARVVLEHALHRAVRLPGVGGPERQGELGVRHGRSLGCVRLHASGDQRESRYTSRSRSAGSSRPCVTP